jgi:hypothetical protein
LLIEREGWPARVAVRDVEDGVRAACETLDLGVGG